MKKKTEIKYKKRYWTTIDGTDIEYKKLENNHLLNILKWIKRRAKDGMMIASGGGGWDIDDCWYEEYEIKGEEVLEKYDYKGLLLEAKRRKLKCR